MAISSGFSGARTVEGGGGSNCVAIFYAEQESRDGADRKCFAVPAFVSS